MKMRLPWQKKGADSTAQEQTEKQSSSSDSPPDQSVEKPIHGEELSIQNKEANVTPSTGEKSSPRLSAQEPDTATRNGKEAGVETAAPRPDEDPNTNLELTASRATQATSIGEAGEDDESKYPGLIPLATLTFGLCVATFLIALDNTIIATAIPKITTVFDSLNDVGWYGSSYLLTTTSLQPSFGKVYTYFNIKWTYLSAILIFEVGSVICAAATSSTMLIVGRAIAGVGAAALFSGAMIIIAYSVPLRKRAIYIAMLSSMFGIASVVGPVLGGAFTDRLSWRWCFWINLPFGGIAIGTVFFFFKNPERKHSNLSFREKIAQIDLLGAFFLICSITCLLLTLQWGGSVYPWSNSKVWGCMLGFCLMIGIFIGLQFKLGDRATIPPRILLKQRTILACALFSLFLSMGLYAHIFYVPFYFQAVKGTTAEESGIRTIPYLISITLSSIIVGGSITALGPYVPFTYAGSIVFVIGAALLYTLKVSSGPGMWIGYQVLAGFGAGACVQIPFIAVQVVLNKKDMPSGNAIAIFFNTLGGAVAVSVAQNIFSNSLIKEIPRYAPGVDPDVIIGAGAANIRNVTSEADLPGVLEAYNRAVTSTFILPIVTIGLACFCATLFEWKSVKGRSWRWAAGLRVEVR